ncbi:flagellar basal body rod protein FlgC [Shigella flexneri]|uniref:Flagellar basal body rod protein FlgC n=3 Tax=Shigella flexneri TaxID=623 RepID=A0A8B6WWB5_SHIFL|nr:flagellar basal-body rod protein flgC [Shigella flexneri 2003036]AIL40078.1 flagellar basal-body rod protein flgC [Shigella flexneri Shi06HN006]EFS14883.1 flagellar basal-body rod protein flgC [Shigella flexneri 2a str. 2457T]EGJ88555.1 flagellar basal-body rod protein flgC [Shigella flexneri 4343-70]EGJ89952.1 flagellar basal-body rod protein flgC [Shigella flexneri 2747-71]EGJ91702.1 flagellar basal-body rod protein flgC [Shigella flexneri K-671]EGJ97873.1 flagella basal body rod family 
MALLNIFDIAGSALTAQSQRLNVAASNLANADSVTGPDGQPYRAKQVVFQVNAAPGAATGGVKVADVKKVRPRTNWFMNQVIRWQMQRAT